MRRRGAALVVASALCVSAMSVGASVPQDAHGLAAGMTLAAGPGGVRDTPSMRILSTPDFLNADVADLSGLPRWNGRHNSTNRSYERSLRVVLDQFRSERPDHVLVAGDLVEGHWGEDVSRTGVFGPVRTRRQRLAAVRRAGTTYYTQWRQRFARHRLPLPHIAVGDHEIGDDPWPRGSFDAWAVPTYKKVVADQLIGGRYPAARRPQGTAYARTSYWQPLSRDVALVSVDVFQRGGRGRQAVQPTVTGRHLRWFNRTLGQLKRRYRWVIVQAHTPVLGRVRAKGSSRLMLRGGARSGFWRAMARHDVDLYLAGEVHDVTAIDPRRGPTQVTHGGLFAFGGTRYLLIDQYADRLELRAYRFSATRSRRARMWQTSWKRAVPRRVHYRPGRRLVGTAILHRDGRLTHRTGHMAVARRLGNRR